MIHGVAAGVEVDSLEVDAERFRHLADLLRFAGDTDDALRDVADVVLHHVDRVAFGVDADEIGMDVLALVTEFLQPAVEFEQRCRADFRAVGKAEEQC